MGEVAENGENEMLDDMPIWNDGEPKDDAKAHCKHCGWDGTFGKTKIKHVRSDPESWATLSGREGYEYFCPKCGWIITAWYWAVS